MAHRNRESRATQLTGIAPTSHGGCLVHSHAFAPGLGPSATTRVLEFAHNTWRTRGDVPDVAHTMVCLPDLRRTPLVVTRGGVRALDGGADVGPESGSTASGFLTDLRNIGGRYYCCGIGGCVQVRTAGSWEPVGALSSHPASEYGLVLLNAVAGLSSSNLVVVGTHGLIFHWNGSRWAELESPTHGALHGVLAIDEQRLFVCGEDGALYLGRTHGWRRLSPARPGVTYRDLAYCGGQLYILSNEPKLYTLNSLGRLEDVADQVPALRTVAAISASANTLWAVSGHCVLRFEAGVWAEVICPPDLLPQTSASHESTVDASVQTIRDRDATVVPLLHAPRRTPRNGAKRPTHGGVIVPFAPRSNRAG